MNPDNNNPFNPTSGDPLGNTGATPGVGGLSMNDSLASAQDNLTSAGLAVDNSQGVMGLDQIGASAPEAIMTPPSNEPLVPAAPVPGSIGSVTSVPPIEPQPAPAPEVSQPYNPFAPNPVNEPATPAAEPVNPLVDQPAVSNPAPAPTPAGAAPIQPAPSTMSHAGGVKEAFRSPITLIMTIAAVIFLIATIVFVVLWRQAVDNPRIVYVPTVSENNTTTAPKEAVLTCVRPISAESIAESGDTNIVSGENNISINYYGDDIESLTSVTTSVYSEAAQAEVARTDAENNWPVMRELYGVTDDILSVSYTTDGNVFRAEFNINPSNTVWVNNTLSDLGVATDDTDHSSEHVQSSAEAAGFACVTE